MISSDTLALDLSALVGFGTNSLNRLSEKRDDAAFIASLRHAQTARTFLIARDMPLVRVTSGTVPQPLFTFAAAKDIGIARETVLLGQSADGPVFAVLLDPESIEASAPTEGQPTLFCVPGRTDVAVRDLRSLATEALLSHDLVGQLGQAKSILHWHAKHRFCSACGTPSLPAQAGWRRDCPACGTSHFPRTDPVVIMLATHGDRCLLGRQPRFPAGMYSALAGFLEPGETMEAAVRREILEESGIRIGKVTYLASQPWPFPASLMMGCHAEALTTDITVDDVELEDARWFSRAEARAMLQGTHADGLSAPKPVAIAHHILKAWVEQG